MFAHAVHVPVLSRLRAVLAVDDGLPARCGFRVARVGLLGDGPVFALGGRLAGGVNHAKACYSIERT